MSFKKMPHGRMKIVLYLVSPLTIPRAVSRHIQVFTLIFIIKHMQVRFTIKMEKLSELLTFQERKNYVIFYRIDQIKVSRIPMGIGNALFFNKRSLEITPKVPLS